MNNSICSRPWLIVFLFAFQRGKQRKRRKPRGEFWFINLLQKLMQLIKTMLTKRSEKQFCKDFEPRLGGGQKYSKNLIKVIVIS